MNESLEHVKQLLDEIEVSSEFEWYPVKVKIRGSERATFRSMVPENKIVPTTDKIIIELVPIK